MVLRKFKVSPVPIVALLVFLFAGATQAQTPVPVVYHPGQTITVTVTFEGKDADKIVSAAMNMTIPEQPKDQAGFQNSFYSPASKNVGPNKFEISFTIPDLQASGDYKLDQIRAFAGPGSSIVLYYNPPVDFTTKIFRIENSAKFDKPKIKDVQ